MQDRFDPYQQWLGIPAAEQPPDHYRLLGLPQFTDDRAAISRAAQARIGQVRLVDAGRQPELAQRLVAELTLARQTLLDPPKKLTYDAILRGARVSQAATRPAPRSGEQTSVGSAVGRIAAPSHAVGWIANPSGNGGQTANPPGTAANLPDGLAVRPTRMPAPIPSPGPSGTRADTPPVIPGTAGVAAGANGVASVSPGGQAGCVAPGERRTDWPHVAPGTALVAGIVGVGAAAIILGLVLSFASTPRGTKHDPLSASPQRSLGAGVRPARAAGTVAPRERQAPRAARPPRGPEVVAGRQPAARTRNVADSVVQGEPAAGSPEVVAALTAARRAMFDRDLKAAGRDVDRALRAAHSDGDREEAERVSKLLHSLDAFWQAVRDGCRQLQVAEELEIADTRVIVVGVDATGITIRTAGRNLDYAFGELPRSLAVLAAERRLSQDPQAMHLHVGSFLAVDRRGDREEARRRWEKAGPDGQALMPEVALAPPVETIRPGK